MKLQQEKQKRHAKRKRAHSAYSAFLQQRMKEEKEKDPCIPSASHSWLDVSFVSLSSMLGKEWKEMSHEKKLAFCKSVHYDSPLC